MLTKRQKQVLDFIREFISDNDFPPTLDEIKGHLKISSVSTAHHHVRNLQLAGYLERGINQPRSTTPNNETQSISVPLLGLISAGEPIEAIENHEESIGVTRGEIKNDGTYYALRVQGESMINDGIYDGDLVIVKHQKTADNGDTVVAVLDDNEVTLKKYYAEKNRIRLQPANPKLKPRYVKNVEIRGVVVKIVRDFENNKP
jgi:repressor LexA